MKKIIGAFLNTDKRRFMSQRRKHGQKRNNLALGLQIGESKKMVKINASHPKV